MTDSIQARLLGRAEKAPDRRALGFYAEDGRRDCRWLTYAQLLDNASARAGGLAAHGLGPGDVCVVLLPSGPLCAEIVLATWQLGALPLLVAASTMKQLDDRLAGVLRHVAATTQARILFCPEWMSEHSGRLADLRGGMRVLCGEPALAGAPRAEAWARPAADALGGLQLTSGTTGAPRICAWRQDRILAALDGMEAVMQLEQDDRCCNWTPLYHDMGLVNNFLLCLQAAVPLVLLSPRRFVAKPALWLQALSDTAATITWAPNFGYAITAERAKDSELDGVRLEHVRAFWNAAERIHAGTFAAFLSRFTGLGLRAEALSANFGCAENVGGATFSRPGYGYTSERLDAEALRGEGLARLAGNGHDGPVEVVVSCGRPNPGLEIRILSAAGEELDDGRIGEIALKTPSRFSGYLGDEEATARAIHGEVLKTGDLGYRRDGELFWTGRTDERMTIRGKKLDPSEFEALLGGIDGLRQGCFAAFEIYNAEEGTQAAVIVCEVRDAARDRAKRILGEVRRRVSLELGVALHDALLVRERSLAKTTSGKRRHLHYKRLYEMEGASAFETI